MALTLSVVLPLCGGTDTDESFERGLEAERQLMPREALDLFRAIDAIRPDDPVVLQKIAKQLSDLTFIESDLAKKQELAEEAYTYAKRAFALDSASAEIALSLAIIHGKLGIYGGAGDKVRHAREIRKYADRAVKLDPDYAWAHHVLGQWHCAVSELGGAKRFFASVLFGGLPKADYLEGIRHLEKAVELEPDEVTHRVELGFAYAEVRRFTEAREQWLLAVGLPAHGLEDGPAKERAREALATGGDVKVALSESGRGRS